jgi:hypothetical protein
MLSTLDEEDGPGARRKPVRLLPHSPEEEEIEVGQIQDMDMVPDTSSAFDDSSIASLSGKARKIGHLLT